MKYILLVFILLTTVGSAYAWYDGFDYRIPITIDNAGNPALEDYQFNVSLFGINESSIRIVNELCGSTVPHWCENETNGLCYELWFNVSVGSEINNDYYIYYGNNEVSSTSNYDGVFTKTYNDSGLVLELHMDEGTGFSQTNDTSGEGNHGTLTNTNITGNDTSGWQGTDGGQWNNHSDVVFTTGDQLRFDGTDDYVNCGVDASLQVNNDSTFIAWINYTGTTGLEVVLANCDNIGAYGYYLAMYQDDLRFQISTNVVYARAQSLYTLEDGWQHVAATYDGNQIRLYVNGSLVTLDIDTIGSGSYVSTDSLIIGGRDSGMSNLFTGDIDEVRMYNRLLSEDEIHRQYIRSKYAIDAPAVTIGETETDHELIIGAASFYDELTDGLTDFRDSMGKYLVWAIIFFAVSLAFALFAKIKYTLIGSK